MGLMFLSDMLGPLEAVLFASGEPISEKQLAEILKVDREKRSVWTNVGVVSNFRKRLAGGSLLPGRNIFLTSKHYPRPWIGGFLIRRWKPWPSLRFASR